MKQTIKALMIIGCVVSITGCNKVLSDGGKAASGAEGKSVSRVAELIDANFAEQTAQGVVLVDFWAPWCGPCRTQGPIVEKVAAQLGDTAKVLKVNVDQARQSALKFEISSIPTLILLKNGVPVKRFEGVTQADELMAAVKAAMDVTSPVKKEM